MPAFDETSTLELGKNPIPGGAPCGADVADDEQYIDVLAELGKLGRIESDDPDWYKLEQDASNVLASKSKDVEIAAALGHGLFQRHGYAGLAASLGLLTEMVKNFWDGCFPERPRRRKARIETLTDRFSEGGWFRENQPKPDEFDAIDLCVARIDELEASMLEKMPDDGPDFKKFKSGIKELAGRRPKPAAEAAPPAAAPAADAGGGAPAAAPAAPVAASAGSFSAGEVSDTGAARKAVLDAVGFMRKADPKDPLPYGLLRVLKWSKIQLPASEQAKTNIPNPEASKVDALAHQMGNGLFEPLLNGSEGAFRTNDPFWLDLQRYVCVAMQGLGPGFENARQVVMGQTAALVQRLGSGLFELRFANGTPLCGGETKMWIESEVLPKGGDGGAGGGGASNGRLTEASDKARKLAGSGKLKEALKELQEGLSTVSQRRDRFLWRLQIARLCFDSQRLQLAAPLLEECYNEVEKYNISEWEPQLVVDLAQTLYRCRKGLTSAQKDPDAERLRQVEESFSWLCRLDPLAALAAEPSGK